MRIVWLILIGLGSYVLAMVVLFPAAPVVEKIKPQLGPIALQGVNGKLYRGVIDSVRSTDDLLPLEFTDVGWTVAPTLLLKGAAGAKFRFEGYGGQGSGLAARGFNGDVNITDFRFVAQAKELEVLLPVPIASFSGQLSGDISKITFVNELLTHFEGTVTWKDALLESPVPTSLGDVNVQIVPEGEQSHVLTLSATGGDVSVDGTVTMTTSGDFSADVLLTPSPQASPEVINGLRQIARPDAQGRVRFVRQGNVNRLL